MNTVQDYLAFYQKKLAEIETIHPSNDALLKEKIALIDSLKTEFETWPEEIQVAIKAFAVA